jgi:hypothetical protein
MIYAKAHDQTVADDYFSAMQKVEKRLQIGEEKKEDKDVKVQMVFQLIQRLELPELCFEERINIAYQLREVLGNVHEHAPPNILIDQQLLRFKFHW